MEKAVNNDKWIKECERVDLCLGIIKSIRNYKNYLKDIHTLREYRYNKELKIEVEIDCYSMRVVDKHTKMYLFYLSNDGQYDINLCGERKKGYILNDKAESLLKDYVMDLLILRSIYNSFTEGSYKVDRIAKTVTLINKGTGKIAKIVCTNGMLEITINRKDFDFNKGTLNTWTDEIDNYELGESRLSISFSQPRVAMR